MSQVNNKNSFYMRGGYVRASSTTRTRAHEHTNTHTRVILNNDQD